MTNRRSQTKKWTLIVLVLFILVAIIGGTYARYTSTGSGTGTAQVAKWAIKINTVDITDTQNNTFTVTFNEVPNVHVVNGKIAPDTELYADFIVDPAGSEVSIDYEFALGAITANSGTVPTGIAIEKVITVADTTTAPTNGGTEGTVVPADATSGTYKGSILLAAPNANNAVLTANEKKVVRVYIKWTNEDSTARNTSDTTAGITPQTLSMTITGTARQHILSDDV